MRKLEVTKKIAREDDKATAAASWRIQNNSSCSHFVTRPSARQNDI